MKIHDCEQGSSEWFDVRKGCFTASEFGAFIHKNDATSNKARRKLILEKILDGQPKDYWQMLQDEKDEKMMDFNLNVQRGNALEPEARDYYIARTGAYVEQVGFIESDYGGFGCSPDGLIAGAQGGPTKGLEIKCPSRITHAGYLLDGELPDQYKYQVHGSMAVTGLKEWHFLSYHPGQPTLLISVGWNDFTDVLLEGLKNTVLEKRAINSRLAQLWEVEKKLNIEFFTKK